MPGDSLFIDTHPRELPVRCLGAGTTEAAPHRDDCGTCQCEYWNQQEKLIAQVLDELAATKKELAGFGDSVDELAEMFNSSTNLMTDKVNNVWRVLAAMQKKLGGGRV